jgi:hypothetical protein
MFKYGGKKNWWAVETGRKKIIILYRTTSV